MSALEHLTLSMADDQHLFWKIGIQLDFLSDARDGVLSSKKRCGLQILLFDSWITTVFEVVFVVFGVDGFWWWWLCSKSKKKEKKQQPVVVCTVAIAHFVAGVRGCVCFVVTSNFDIDIFFFTRLARR